MPEILTKHPDIALRVLESQGARCGDGIAPKILTHCPREKFCVLDGGELCVYGANELGQMTQLSSADLCREAAPSGPSSTRSSSRSSVAESGARSGVVEIELGTVAFFVAIFAGGMIGARWWPGRRRSMDRDRD